MLHRLSQIVDLREQLRFTLVHSLNKPIAPHQSDLELLYVVSRESTSGLETLGRVWLNIYRPMLGRDFVCRALLGIHVNRKRFAGYFTTIRHLKPLKTVPGMLVGFKKNTVIEQRKIGNDLVVFKVPRIRVKFQIFPTSLSIPYSDK